jgi:hypothetical protein
VRNFLHTLFYSGLFIGLCAAALIYETCLLLRIEVNGLVLWLVLFATIFVYNAHNLLKSDRPVEFMGPRQRWVQLNRNFLVGLSGASALIIMLLLLNNGTRQLLLLLHLGLLAIAYTLPLVPWRGSWRALREVPLIKAFLVAYVWAAATVLLPLPPFSMDTLGHEAKQLLLERFLFLFSLALLFDIRDEELDRNQQTLTFPNLLGTKLTRGLSLLVLLVFCVLAVMWHSGREMVALVASAVVSGVVVVFSKPDNEDAFFLGWADGMMLLQAVLVWIAVMIR